ncbi:MAG: transposase-like protein [Pseudomonadales bacterium]|jgi:transposase-like protein
MVSSIICGEQLTKRACPMSAASALGMVTLLLFLQRRRNAKAVKIFFKRLLRSNKGEPREIVTDKLRSYNDAHRELIPDVDNNSR